MKTIEFTNGNETAFIVESEITHMTVNNNAVFVYLKSGESVGIDFENNDIADKCLRRLSFMLNEQ